MKYTKFTIKNFKGIQSLEFELDGRNPISKTFTLVGLNESGKTTILEALSFFYDNIKNEKELTITKAFVDDVHELIPKSKKDIFNESIIIKSNIEIENSDKEEMKKFIGDEGLVYANTSDKLDITVKLNFKDSSFVDKERLWTSNFVQVKKPGKGKRVSKSLYTESKEVWVKLTTYIEENILPAIIYYPNFLFDFPDQIFLEKSEGESKEQIFYRNVLQDILNSIDERLILQDHIVNRYKSGQSKDIGPIESVVNKMSGQVTRFLTKSKMNIFNKLLENKEILIKYPKKDEEDDIYLEIKLKDGDDEYFIRERSLGFRWFFTFLLFTQFRTFRDGAKNLIFLFDEPASNLHQTGQHRLLEAVNELTANANTFVIYSTHSHHLINPLWLETTYIVKNNALNYEDDGKYNSKMTDVSIIKYRNFVSMNPSQINYFQPVLDVLEYRPSNLENIPDVVMLEGKNDFYTLEYINKNLNIGTKLNFVPGVGSGTLDNLIQLYYSWGRNFIILLDSDGAGKTQKKRYFDKFGTIVREKIFLLEDINSKWSNTEMETIFENGDALNIQKTIFTHDTTFDKSRFNLSVQELLINSKYLTLTSETENNFREILDFLTQRINKF